MEEEHSAGAERSKAGLGKFPGPPAHVRHLSGEAGVDAKTRADQMGHHVDVSENEYAVTNLAAKIEAGRKLEAVI